MFIEGGDDRVTTVDETHPLMSEVFRVYVFQNKLVGFATFPPTGLQVYEYGEFPPETDALIDPFPVLKHVGFVNVVEMLKVFTVKVAVLEITFLQPISTTHLILS